ncbi:hypothetical protein GN956_G25672 [Arapaima gigas]
MDRSGRCAFVGLVVILAAVPRGAAVSCDVTENKTFHECYGAVGKPLFVRLITDTTGYQIDFKSPGNEIVFEFRKDKAVVRLCCFNFINNGTLKLDKAEQNYSGQYSLDILDSSGTNIQQKKVKLIIIEPVSSPVVSTLCLPHGKLMLSCSATGDSPRYSWTLKDRPLGSGCFDDGNGVIILKKNERGDVTCTVWNNVSRANTTLTLPTCTGRDCLH